MSTSRIIILSLIVIAAIGFVVYETQFHEADFSAYTPENLFKQGQMSANGWGRDPDPDDAIVWYTQAAEKGHVEAAYQMADMYYLGMQIEQDHELALKWYRQAAEGGHVEAMNRLGWMYYHGEGVSPDREESQKWYDLAGEPSENAIAEPPDSPPES